VQIPKVQTLADIRGLITAGSTISGAVREAIDQRFGTTKAFAATYGVDRRDLSRVINGMKAPSPRITNALITAFGGTEIEWRSLLHEAGAPVPVTSVAAVG
jgi:plasmid maintenance system antidote protein VapI